MLLNYLKITLRNISRHKGYYLINIIGLAIGLAISFLIFLYVIYEFSFDKFHEKSDRIYRLEVNAMVGNTEIHQTGTPAPMARALYDEFPEIQYVTRTFSYFDAEVRHGEKVFIEKRATACDSTFFDLFDFTFIYGSPEGSLNDPNEVVITRSMAEKYFREGNPVGKVLKLSTDYFGDMEFKVTAVVEDLPANSHMHPELITSLLSYEGFYDQEAWFWNIFTTYFCLHRNTTISDIEKRFPAFVDKYLFSENSYDEWASKGNKWEYSFQPLEEIHLTSDLSGEFEANGNKDNVYIFLIVAIFILAIACVNFMNLTTAKSANRAREVGIRKVVGATRAKLVKQFIGESVMVSILAFLIALLIVEIIHPYYNHLIGYDLAIDYLDKVWLIPSFLGLAIFVGIISGSYPAFYLSSFMPVSILKGKLVKGSGNKGLRNVLVVFQLLISIALIIGTMTIYRQLDLLQNRQLGFNKERVLIIRNPMALDENIRPFINRLEQNAGVSAVSASTTVPGVQFNNIGFRAAGVDETFTLNLCLTDPGFEDVFGVEMFQGRFFNDEFKKDSSAIIINEAALNLLGWENAIGRSITDNSDEPHKFHVIGVVKNLRYESPEMKIRPMAFLWLDGLYHWPLQYISIRYRSDDPTVVIREMEEAWNEFSPQLPPDYSFMDKIYAGMYDHETRARQLLLSFSFLAIIIACMGLFGLSSFMAEQRTREIGVRKAFGATIENIYLLLSREFLRWVVVANVIAWPLAWWGMDRWLDNYAFRVGISWWIFFLAAAITFLVTLITTGVQGYLAASTDPVRALRYE